MQKKVSIIGTGALGRVLALGLTSHGVTVAGLYNRSEPSLSALNKEVDAAEVTAFPAGIEELGEVIFLTVPDSQIKEVAEKLAGLSSDFSGRIIVHCSGTAPSGWLASLQAKGALTASFHPLQTFTETSAVSDLEGIWFDIEGDQTALASLKKLARLWNSECLEIRPEAKPYLHAAAVMGSNYLVALLELSSAIAAMGGLDKEEARRALLPLIQTTLKNSATAPNLSGALSGPVARGDASTVEKHLQLLEHNPRVLALYKQLGAVALELTASGKEVPDETLSELSKLFQS